MEVKIETYNPNWPLQFEALKKELYTLLQDFQAEIEHIGSTSVPDLAAKPIIDIQVGLPTLEQIDFVIPKILTHPNYIYSS